jgi:hypothetical protein
MVSQKAGRPATTKMPLNQPMADKSGFATLIKWLPSMETMLPPGCNCNSFEAIFKYTIQ